MVIESASPPKRSGPRSWRPELGGGPRRRRTLKVIAGLLAVMFIIGAVFWFQIIPRYRPDLQAGERYGIDVSNHQGPIEWDKVADDNVDLST